MAAPVAGRVFADILPYLGIAPRYSEEEQPYRDIKIPNVTGKSIAQAEKAIKDSGLDCEVKGSGNKITAQIPAAGLVLPASSRVMLFTEGVPELAAVVVPSLQGKTPGQASIILANVGLFLRPVGAVGLGGSALKAAFQEIPAGEEVPYGTIINVEFRDDSVNDGGTVTGRGR
jgi:stage V sporulation protein D (sporulation-specific penicillin-binding protein)